ncbi:MAG: methyltransferase domain-containing protein [Candidatus Peribacteraceae bacterium]|nr:methyltransferase domain-containing protein [Candidatus Peribacteraceae bacterium]MBP9850385.1 methyltransferase domain-containing protein [Candidatus Peribacteraceae bacterium]
MITHHDSCRMCGHKELTMFLDLHDQPQANLNIKPGSWVAHPETMYPLQVYFCHNCYLVQLLDDVSKEELFSQYQFVSSGVGNTPKHFQEYAKEVMDKHLKPGEFIIEVGGNDGVLMGEIKDRKTLNIEPAQNIAPMSRARGVETINDFFTSKLAKEVSAKYGKAQVVMGNNSIPHIGDQIDVMKGFKELLALGGTGIIQAHYLGYIFDTLGYGDVYHEHMSYYALRPLISFYKQFDLEIYDYEMLPFQGVSIRIFFGHKGEHPIHPRVDALVKEELAKGWDKLETYQKLARDVEKSKNKLVALLKDLKSQGKRIAAYGAAAKGVPILNYAGITDEIIDFCVDGLPQKQGLCMPMSHIQIISPEEARTRDVDYYLLLAWSFRDHIAEKEKDFRAKGGKFIMPIGDIEVF